MKNSILIKVLAALGLAILAGVVTGDMSLLGIPLIQFYGLIGNLFLNALNLVVVPLVCSSIITGTARMGNDSSFKKLGKKTFICFLGTTFIAVLVGYLLIVTLQPGSGQNDTLASPSLESNPLQETISQKGEEGFQKIEQLLLRLVPTNILAAAAQGQMLGLIAFCIFFGFFLTKIEKPAADSVISFFQGIFQIMMKITQMIMKALPVGVFFLVAKVVATTGLESITSAAAFFGVILLGLAIEMFIIFPLLLKVIAGVSPLAHFKAMTPALLTAFSTSSSAATMPVTLDCLEKNANVSPRICGFTVPLGTSINTPGSALHICCSVFFIAQVYHFPLSISLQCTTLLMIILMSFGIAGIPSASLFAIVTVLTMIGLPAEGIALILAVERLVDMCRTTVNVFGNSCCAVLIEHADKQKDNRAIDPQPVATGV
ncbi:MAG: dicarboxylate/amino acid:cation symporter [Parachlamydiaceae bacterium]|nr:dicarboxylate/amino acid:cation symporter [Parachlamydiaceae bacterium]